MLDVVCRPAGTIHTTGAMQFHLFVGSGITVIAGENIESHCVLLSVFVGLTAYSPEV